MITQADQLSNYHIQYNPYSEEPNQAQVVFGQVYIYHDELVQMNLQDSDAEYWSSLHHLTIAELELLKQTYPLHYFTLDSAHQASQKYDRLVAEFMTPEFMEEFMKKHKPAMHVHDCNPCDSDRKMDNLQIAMPTTIIGKIKLFLGIPD